MTHTYTALLWHHARVVMVIFMLRWCLHCFLFWHSQNHSSGIPRQVSGDQTPCQEQFGVSAESSFCGGAVMGGWDQSHLQDVTSWAASEQTKKARWHDLISHTAVQYVVLAFFLRSDGLRMSHRTCYKAMTLACQQKRSDVICAGESAGPFSTAVMHRCCHMTSQWVQVDPVDHDLSYISVRVSRGTTELLSKPSPDKTSAVQNQEVNKQATPDNKRTSPQEPEMKNCFLPPTSPWGEERRWENKFCCRAESFRTQRWLWPHTLITADYSLYTPVKCVCGHVWLWQSVFREWRYERSFCLTDLFVVYKEDGDIYTVQMCGRVCVTEAPPGRLWEHGCHYYSAVPASKSLLSNIFPLR